MRLKGVELKGKALLKWAFHLIPVERAISPEVLSKRRIDRILAIRIDNRLGNLLLITPFLRRVRLSFPDAKIDLLVSRAFAEVLEGNPSIDRRIIADKADFIRRPWRFLHFIRDMRGNRYDLAIDLSSSHTFFGDERVRGSAQRVAIAARIPARRERSISEYPDRSSRGAAARVGDSFEPSRWVGAGRRRARTRLFGQRR